jgi:hypothetical protein
MITPEEQFKVWISTYNAALTGLLASRVHEMEGFSPNSVNVVTELCKAFAHQALKNSVGCDRNMPNP